MVTLFLWRVSCWDESYVRFRKDLEALLDYAIKNSVELPIIEAVLKVNRRQPYRVG